MKRLKKTESTTKFVGTSIWQKVKLDTGEIIDQRPVMEFEKRVGREEHFMVTYLGEIISLIDNLGNKKMKVVKYILQNMSKSNNAMFCTTRELAEKLKMSPTTVNATLVALEKANIIKRRTGGLMLSPRLLNCWTSQKEASMMVTYRDFDEHEREEINVTPKPLVF